MVHTVVERETVGNNSAFRDKFLQAYRGMVLARVMDEKFASLYRSSKIHGGVFLGRGQEALSVATGLHLRAGDFYAPLIRDAAGRLAFGEPVIDAVRTYLGSPLGPMRARDGNVHRGTPKTGYLPMISHLGAMVSVVNGSLMAQRFQGIRGTVGAVSIGEGGTSTGAFHEGINQAAVEKLPLVVVVANNQYAYSTPNSRQFACADLADKAAGYGIESHSLMGNDLGECLEIVGGAIERARAGGGPQLVVAKLLRLCGHGEHDDPTYMDLRLKREPYGRDCLTVAEERIGREEWADAAMLESWRDEAVQLVESTVAGVQRESPPDPYTETWHALATTHLIEGHNLP